MYLYLVCIFILLYILFDVNYLLRTYFIVLWGRWFESSKHFSEVTTIYGICTFQDCDVWFRNIRIARLIRELDFARYHFYLRTGIYKRCRLLSIRSLQGCTFTVSKGSIPLFAIYKINTKLLYWDDRSLFFEHEVVTVHDGRVIYLLISRQHGIRSNGDIANAMMQVLPGGQRPDCPKHIEVWLKSMEITSNKMRNTT